MEVVYGQYVWIKELQVSPDQFGFWKKLPSFLQKEIKKYQKPDDQMRQFAGKFLLLNLLSLHHKSALIETYQTAEYGKPIISDFSPFNLSHSGHISAIVWTKATPIGLDVQLHKPVNIPLFDKQFSPTEMQTIKNAPQPNNKFFDLWTKKESVIKADGRGLHLPLHQVELYEDYAILNKEKRKWFYQSLQIPAKYTAHVCMPAPFKVANWEKVSFLK